MRSIRWTAALMVLALACGDGDLTAPPDVSTPRVPQASGDALAIGTDATTGATLETDKDDYAPGEVVHLRGSGWAAGESINLHMTESPDTHGDVDTTVVADTQGAFDIHFYDVQQHDLGVTFTLVGTGATSRSSVTVTFTDGQVKAKTNSSSVTIPVTWTRYSASLACASGLTTSGLTSVNNAATEIALPIVSGQSLSMTAPSSAAGQTFVNWSSGSDVRTTTTICVAGSSGSDVWTASYQAANSAPTVLAGNDATINEGATFSQAGSFTDPDANTWTGTVNYGDGTGNQPLAVVQATKSYSLSHLYTQDGNYIVTVSINDGTTTSTDQVGVTVNNVAPTATFNALSSVNVNASFALSLTSSIDPSSVDYDALTFSFDCGTGTFSTASSTNGTTCSIGTPGAFVVRGRVHDDDAFTEYDANIMVSNVVPSVDAGAAKSGNEGSAIAISGTGSDPDGGTVTYAWTASSPLCTVASHANTTSSTTVTCTDNGNFTLTLKVTDDEGDFITDDAALDVANVAPTIAGLSAPSTVNEGPSFNFAVTTTMDPSSIDVAAGIHYFYSCDNGANYTDAGTVPSFMCPAPDGPATVKIAVKARDKDLEFGNVLAADVQVENVAPVVTITSDETVNEGQNASFNATVVDPGAETFSFSWTTTVGSCTLQSSNLTSATFKCVDEGSGTVTLDVDDNDGGTDSDQANLTVNNVDPSVNITTAPATIDEGDSKTFNATVTDPGINDVLAPTWSDNIASCTLQSGSTLNTATFLCTDEGSGTVSLSVSDGDGGTGSDNVALTVNNVDPSVTITTAAATINEGSSKTFAATVTDPGIADVLTPTWSDNIASCTLQSGETLTSATFLCVDDGNGLVALSVNDGDGGIGSDSESLTVNNVAPTVTNLTGTAAPAAVGTTVSVTPTFSDPAGTNDTYTAWINWDDGNGSVNSGATTSGTAITRAFTQAGVYTVCITVRDEDGGVSAPPVCYEYLVVYDPNGGFVTGGGWITSPTGAYPADPTLTGKANFGFVSKYQKGQSAPNGHTEFQFHAGSFDFKSSAYQWLVIAGPKGQYKGQGSVNGVAGFGFMVTGWDGQAAGGGGTDKFRIKVWRTSDGVVVYDNQFGQLEDSNAATAIGGGSIVIHSK